ncbi:hypothetical protein AURDEDRAFT_117606 [Auricularia subglabra TFB-10046 SS5]|uniref:Thioesterase domain-containing protein n=1 Tax=Auricularia subglabra (strain TFB-10046 / SS5) TaxID=717982 RepID=J0WQ74_AURST|nr:hypothetical protein AURDEDRAFT_117606 [Auricularia subglabra TFB-10046 SS5]
MLSARVLPAARSFARPVPLSRRLASTLSEKRDISYAHAQNEAPAFARHPPANTKYWNIRLSRPLAASIALVLSGVAVGVWIRPDVQVAYHPPKPLSVTAKPATGKAEHSPRQLEKELAALPLIAQLRHEAFEKRESDLWREARPYQIQEAKHAHTLVGGSLLGREKIAIPPYVRERKDGSEGVVVVHVGNDLCGHEGIVHGGLVATLFDQYLYRLGFATIGSPVVATANLSVDYRAPVRANQFLVFKMRRETSQEELERKPNKVTIVGRLEDVDGKLLAEGRGLFVAPRDGARFLKATPPGSA